jgi:hypothetical protein
MPNQSTQACEGPHALEDDGRFEDYPRGYKRTPDGQVYVGAAKVDRVDFAI